MGIRNIEKTAKIIDANGNEVETVVKRVQLNFDGSALTVSERHVAEDGSETLTPYLVQPWKCNSDGTREPFTGEQDAFDWLEQNTNLY